MYRFLVLFLASMLLTSCASGPASIDGRKAPLTDIPPDQGIALLKAVAIAIPSAFNIKWRSILLEDSTGQTFSLADVAPPTKKYSLFMGTLPAGQYEIKRLDAAGNTSMGLLIFLMTNDSARIESRLPKFEVRKGTVSNLGTIVFQLPKGGDAASLRYVLNEGEIGKEAALADLYPEDQNTIKAMPAYVPSNPPQSDRLALTEALVRQSPPAFTRLIRLADGRIAASGIAGFLHIREPDGSWRSVHTNSFDTLSSLNELVDHTLAAGTESGKYFLIEPDRKTVETYRLSDPDLSISEILSLDRFGYALRTSRSNGISLYGPSSYYVLRKTDLHVHGGETQLLGIDGFSAYGSAPIYFHKTELFQFFNEPGFRRTTKMTRMDLESGKKSEQEFNFWAIRIEPGNDNELVLTRMNGLSLYRSISNDNGRSWKAIEDELPISFISVGGQIKYGLRKVSTGWDTVQMVLNKSEDNGKTWRDSGSQFTVSTGVPLLVGAGDNAVVVYTGTDVRSTTDDGNTWKVEWPRQ